jgi:hypothetical protein
MKENSNIAFGKLIHRGSTVRYFYEDRGLRNSIKIQKSRNYRNTQASNAQEGLQSSRVDK